MGKTESRLNKRILGAVIGSAVIWLTWFSMTPKGKSFWNRAKKKLFRSVWFLKRGYQELKKEVTHTDKPTDTK